MEQFEGSWGIIPSENITGDKEAFKAMLPGGFDVPDAIKNNKQIITFTIESSSAVNIKMAIGGKEKSQTHTLGSPFDITTPHGKTIKVTTSLEGSQLKTHLSGEHEVDIVRNVSGNQMTVDISCAGKSCRATYTKE